MSELENTDLESLSESLTEKHFHLLGWLFEKHKDVLREYEKEFGKLNFMKVDSSSN